MLIGIPKETVAGETRVAATPETVKKFAALGLNIVVQSGAGLASSATDAAYEAAGAKIAADAAATLADADIVLKVVAPTADETALIKQGATVLAAFAPHQNEFLEAYAAKGLTCVSMELIPRITRAQSSDILSSQANLAGYKAVLLAANEYAGLFPMMMTAAGTIKPARTVVLGVGVAGLQAIATAKRLGSVVEASDLRPAAKEQVESLGGRWLDVPMSDEEKAKALGTGGYAWQPSPEYIRDQAVVVDKAVSNANIVITTAQIPGRKAPVLVKAETVAKMKPGSIIVDMAVSTGGNVEGSKLDETVV
ncbi:MAG: NAD(P)(+) transhydrogenase (Re/Si-specific) subunit alpha, partial [Acinetobacter sp.]|nr:NAD(P)(+) transhydrogenase (Re/Si-specific) subunit alpha [Acinetobacter sp.]